MSASTAQVTYGKVMQHGYMSPEFPLSKNSHGHTAGREQQTH